MSSTGEDDKNQNTMNEENKPSTAEPEMFVMLIKQTLFEALKQGGEWASPELVDEVLDFINNFGKQVKK